MVKIIKDIASRLGSIGLNVLCTVCDQGLTNRSALNILKNKNNITYFKINEQKIFTLFDSPHLLKCVRNAFEKYDIKFDGTKIAHHVYLKQAFEVDQQKRFQALVMKS